MEQQTEEDIENLRRPCKSSLGILLRRGNGSLVVERKGGKDGLNNKAHSPGTSADRTLPSKEAFRVRLFSGG